MYREPTRRERPRARAPRSRQRGLGLVGAISLIGVVAVFAAGMVSLVRQDAARSSETVLATRAFLAAESGAQLALNRLHAPDGAGACVARDFDLDQPGLVACVASTACTAETVDGDVYFTVVSHGTCDAGDLRGGRTIVVRTRP